jgi:hypothetical protein
VRHNSRKEYIPSVAEYTRSSTDHSTQLYKANEGRRISEHHARAFDKAQKRAVKALKKGVTRLQGRSAMRYIHVQGDAVFETDQTQCELTIWNEAKSHRAERLQVVRSKLLRLANVVTAAFDDWSPRRFFRELEETDAFEKFQFVHAIQSASSTADAQEKFVRDKASSSSKVFTAAARQHSTPLQQAKAHFGYRRWSSMSPEEKRCVLVECDPSYGISGKLAAGQSDFEPSSKQSAFTRISTTELVELFRALDTHGTGLVPIEAIEAFVFGDVSISQPWQRQQEPEWQYPLSHEWLDTSPRTLRLDLSLVSGPPALIITWGSQDLNLAHKNGTGNHARAKTPRPSVVGACCATPEQHPSRRIPSTSAPESAPGSAVEQSVRISLSEVRSVIFGAATNLILAPGAYAFDHWNSFSVCTSDMRWDFACAAAQDARRCFLALQSVLVPVASTSMERLWGRILWHSARARLRTLATVLQLSHNRTMVAILAHPKQPTRRKPIDRMRHQTLAGVRLKQREQRQTRLQKADGQVLESDWIDGSRLRSSRLPPGLCVDVEGYGRGEVVSTSTDGLDEPVHTIQFEHANTTEHKTLKLQHVRAGDGGRTHSSLPFLVEVAKLR